MPPHPQERQAEHSCENDVLLCLAIVGGETGSREQIPITFGHPLAPGLLQPGQRMIAKFGGANLPVQLDQVATHYDGSVRFAIFTVVLPRVSDRGPRKLELMQDTAVEVSPPRELAVPKVDFRVEIDTYASKVYELTFGNRNGTLPGIPFKVGETITLVLGEGAATERFTVTITPELAGGGHGTLTELAKAFVPVMSRSPLYRAHRDAAEVYETLWITSRQKPGTNFALRIEYAGAAKIDAKVVQSWEPRASYVASASSAGNSATSSKEEQWLSGPLAREWIRSAPLRSVTDNQEHPLLSVLIGVRQYAGSSSIRYEAVVENTFALPGGIRNREYDIVFVSDGKRVFEARAVVHHVFTRWHRIISDGQSAKVLHDRKRLLESRAVPFYDPTLRPPENVLAQTYGTLMSSDRGATGSAMVTRYMPMTGGRPDIGPLPSWSVLHILSQDPRMELAVLANGDAAGNVPMHYRERVTGRPMNVAWNPTARIYGPLFVNFKVVAQGWTMTPYVVDTAHQPSLAYYPYLLTGERFYLDELHFWASWNGLYTSLESREGTRGLVYDNQVRAQAWSIRTLGHAALVTPDSHSMKSVFNNQLQANITWYNKHYATAQPQERGRLPGWLESEHIEDMAPWQHDFMTMAISLLAENDVPGARQFFLWLTRFGLGRFLAEKEGYCRANAPGYYVRVMNPVTKEIAKTWQQVHQLNWPEQKSCSQVKWLDPYTSCTSCYTTIARAALATMVSAGLKEAEEPYDYLRTVSENRNANLAADPVFAIVPRQ